MRKQIDRWLAPVGIGTALVLGLLWFFAAHVRLRPPPPTAPVIVKPAIAVVAARQTDAERRELTDLDPLFLPTSHNTSVLSLPAQLRREPGSMSFKFPAKLSELESHNGVPIAENIAIPAQPIGVLTLGQPAPRFPEFRRADLALPHLNPRLAFLQVAEAKTGRIVLAREIPLTASAPLPSPEWTPLQFLVAVDRMGLVGSPVVTSSAASEEVEGFFTEYLVKNFSLGARLTPGFYTVHLGP